MKSLSDLWDSILARLSGELSDMTIKTWFDEITVVTMEDSALVLHCSNAFKKNTVEARFLPQIKAALKDIFSTDMEVKILNDEQLAAYHGVAPDRPGDLFDSDAFTFETYVVGPQNKLAYAAAKSVAEKPAEERVVIRNAVRVPLPGEDKVKVAVSEEPVEKPKTKARSALVPMPGTIALNAE